MDKKSIKKQIKIIFIHAGRVTRSLRRLAAAQGPVAFGAT